MPARLPFLVALLLSVVGAPGGTLEPAERELLLRTLRPAMHREVEKALGGMDRLPLLAAEVRLDGEARRVRGTVRLDWPNSTGTALKELPLRVSGNEGARRGAELIRLTAVEVEGARGRLATAETTRVSPTITRVKLPSALAPGKRVALHVRFEGTLPLLPDHRLDAMQSSLSAILGGGAPEESSQYGTFACGGRICTLTGFLPEVPAFIEGRFDEAGGSGIGDATYSEPMNVLLSVVTDAGWKVAATGLEVGRVPEGEGLRRYTFALAAGREVGVIASPEFETREAQVRGITVRSFSRPGTTGAGQAALDAARGGLEVFDETLGKYPWTVLTVAESALTGGAGGLELPTLALVASNLYHPSGLPMPFDPMTGVRGDLLDFVTLHEVAHQWWHAQVGSHAQLHPYVDEPLAQYSALVATGRLRGAEARQRARALQVALNFQALGMFGQPDGPVARPAGKFASQIEYAGLVYGKAPLFYEAVADLVGEKVLLATLRRFVEKNRFQRVTPEALKGALVAGAGANGPRVSRLWQRWFLERHGKEDVGELNLQTLLQLSGIDAGAAAGLLGGADAEAIMPQLEEAFESARQLLEEFHRELHE